MARLRLDDKDEQSGPAPTQTCRRQLVASDHTSPSARSTSSIRKIQTDYHSILGPTTAESMVSPTLIPKGSTAIKVERSQVRLPPRKLDNTTRNSSFKSARRVMSRRQAQVPRSERNSNDDTNAPAENLTLLPGPSPQKEDDGGGDRVDIGGGESIYRGSSDDPESSSDDEELPSARNFMKFPRGNSKAAKTSPGKPLPNLALQLKALSIFDDDPGTDTAKQSKPESANMKSLSRSGSSSDKENEAITHFSPPRSKKPQNKEQFQRPLTPPHPASPSKAKLQSPSKRIARIPTPPHRPSLDAFWTADAVNDWNDQYSPQKPLKSPRKLFFAAHSNSASPTTSPGKPQSPTKRTKAELDSRKDFEVRKVVVAEAFLHELDQTITNGQVQQLALNTGGVHLIWSKTLNSTAGRANWRRETIKSTHANGGMTSTHKHFASIELATKVIDCEHRLLNVIAHEFCHLANFMISGIKDQPHGKQFKEWGRLCTKAFGNRGVQVTTKHSYEIEYKYIWQCVNEDCGMEFKRHSKSIDPSRHRCGGCKASLMQIKPVPRKGSKQHCDGSATTMLGSMGEHSNNLAVTGYAAYVKQHFAVLKKSMPGASHKDVMQALGRKYRADKATSAFDKPDFDHLADAVAKDLEKVKLGGSQKPFMIDSD